MCTNSTSKPFFLKRPSSCATQAPLMLLAKEVQAMRVFICAAKFVGIPIAIINATAILNWIFMFAASG